MVSFSLHMLITDTQIPRNRSVRNRYWQDRSSTNRNFAESIKYSCLKEYADQSSFHRILQLKVMSKQCASYQLVQTQRNNGRC